MKAVKFDTDTEVEEDYAPNFDNLKNRKKVELLKEIDLSKYDEKMIRLLLDGDYKGELPLYKNKVMMLVHEIIDKKIAHTKFGVNTLLYKLVRDAKNDRPAGANIKQRQPRKQNPKIVEVKQDSEADGEPNSPYLSTASEEEEMVEVDLDTFVKELMNLAKVDKKRALQVLNYNIPPHDTLHKKLLAKIKKI